MHRGDAVFEAVMTAGPLRLALTTSNLYNDDNKASNDALPAVARDTKKARL